MQPQTGSDVFTCAFSVIGQYGAPSLRRQTALVRRERKIEEAPLGKRLRLSSARTQSNERSCLQFRSSAVRARARHCRGWLVATPRVFPQGDELPTHASTQIRHRWTTPGWQRAIDQLFIIDPQRRGRPTSIQNHGRYIRYELESTQRVRCELVHARTNVAVDQPEQRQPCAARREPAEPHAFHIV